MKIEIIAEDIDITAIALMLSALAKWESFNTKIETIETKEGHKTKIEITK